MVWNGIDICKLNACEVFEDDNEGLIFGLESVDENHNIDYVEWFKTEEERDNCIKENGFKVI